MSHQLVKLVSLQGYYWILLSIIHLKQAEVKVILKNIFSLVGVLVYCVLASYWGAARVMT